MILLGGSYSIRRAIFVLNVLSEGTIFTAFLGLIGFGIWHLSYLGMCLLGTYIVLWLVSLVIKTFPTQRMFQRLSTLHLSKQYKPELAILIMNGDVTNLVTQRHIAVKACQELQRRLRFSVNSMVVVIIGFLLISKGAYHQSANILYPLIQGILGALLGMVYAVFVRRRVDKLLRIISET